MLEIIPGILEKNWSEIEKKLEIARSFAKTIHVDIIDGKFTPNTTFLDSLQFAKYSRDLFFELHMMVEDPIRYLEPFAEAGFKRFIGHVEKMPDQAEFVAKAQLLGEVGLAIDGPTDISEIKVPYGDLDCVLIMTVKAGMSGQEFNPEYLKKVEAIRLAAESLPIEIDGGIDDRTIIPAIQAGACKFASTSFIFNSQDPKARFNLLKNIALSA